MNTLVNRAGAQATVYTKLGQALRVPLPPLAGYSPEQQLARWLTRQAMANPGFPARVKSLLLLVRQPPCAKCRQALHQTLRRWNLAGRLRVVARHPETERGSLPCPCAGQLLADDQLEQLRDELEGSYGSADTKTLPLDGAGRKLKAQGWKNGIYVIKKKNVPIYVGKSIDMGTRIQQHALSLTHLLIKLNHYTVQVYHYPNVNKVGLKAQEQAHYERLIKQYKLGNAVSPELELALELDELALEYEGLFDKFRRLFRQNPVKSAILKGALDASNPLPAKDAALADHVQGITESYVENAQRQPASPPGRPAAAASPPPANRLAQPARSNWAAPTSAYGSRLPSPRVKAPGLPTR